MKRKKFFIVLGRNDDLVEWKLKLMNVFELNEYKSFLINNSHIYEDAFFFDEVFMDELIKEWNNKEGWDEVEDRLRILSSN